MAGLDLSDDLRGLLGARTARALGDALDLHTVGDLLTHYPRRYVERGELTDLRSLELGEHVTVLAKVRSGQNREYHDRRTGRRAWRQEVVVTDGSGSLQLVFFKQKWLVEKVLVPGRVAVFAGKVTEFRGTRQLSHPDYRVIRDGELDAQTTSAEAGEFLAFAGALLPVYPASAKVQSWVVSDAVGVLLAQLPDTLPDPLPAELRLEQGLVGSAEALRLIHRPEAQDDVDRARRRLAWDEALVMQAVLARRRAATETLPATPRVDPGDGVLTAFERRLPFELTSGQLEVGEQITSDLAQPHPMHRLLEGEVGSGKTIVALRAMLTVVDTGGQAVLLAPTEVLAQQHHRSLTAMLGPLAERGLLGGGEVGTRVALVTRSMTAAQRREALLDIGVGDAGIVVGTHALLEERVQFFDLGLVVVDEQHRFGVEQRAALAAKSRDGTRPHVLVMTATPIPRTVAMTVFGDLETSTLTELPAGRCGISTHVVSRRKKHFVARTWERVREEVVAGRQAYVVCSRIGGDADDVADADADESTDGRGGAASGETDEGAPRPDGVLETAAALADGPLAGLRIAVVHGRLSGEDKDAVMRRFAGGDIDVLVATTVIEVGVDVPNATVMVVMDADRFGVSQLHQLRGRVGRGGHAGLCLLLTWTGDTSPAGERLAAVASTTDGLVLSRLDLAQRREGDVLGTSQSGRHSSLRVLEVLRDEDIIVAARGWASRLVAQDRELAGNPVLARAVAAAEDMDEAEYLDKP